jgi:hypothetical protein
MWLRSMFLQEFFYVVQVTIIDMRIWKNGDHIQEDIAKFGYNQDMEYKYLINLLYLWLQIENQIRK